MSNPEAVVYDMVVSDYLRAEITGNRAQMEAMCQTIGGGNISLLGDVALELKKEGVKLVFTKPEMEIDTTPGTNHYVTHGTGLSNVEQRALLQEYAPGVNVPTSATLGALIDGESVPLEAPLVLKNTWDQLGTNKLVVEDGEALEKVLAWGERLEGEDRDDFYLEEQIVCPDGYYSSYRLTALSTGNILAATLKSARVVRSEQPVVTNPALLPLVDPSSHLFIDPHAITSNAATGGDSIALNTPKHSIYPRLSDEELQVLEAHGIGDRQLPSVLNEAGIQVATTIGPSQAFLTGIDFVQDQDGRFHFLESNTSPSLNNVRKTVGLSLSDQHIYIMAARLFARELV